MAESLIAVHASAHVQECVAELEIMSLNKKFRGKHEKQAW
jgi:hypothetical protein